MMRVSCKDVEDGLVHTNLVGPLLSSVWKAPRSAPCHSILLNFLMVPSKLVTLTEAVARSTKVSVAAIERCSISSHPLATVSLVAGHALRFKSMLRKWSAG